MLKTEIYITAKDRKELELLIERLAVDLKLHPHANSFSFNQGQTNGEYKLNISGKEEIGDKLNVEPLQLLLDEWQQNDVPKEHQEPISKAIRFIDEYENQKAYETLKGLFVDLTERRKRQLADELKGPLLTLFEEEFSGFLKSEKDPTKNTRNRIWLDEIEDGDWQTQVETIRTKLSIKNQRDISQALKTVIVEGSNDPDAAKKAFVVAITKLQDQIHFNPDDDELKQHLENLKRILNKHF